MKKNICRRFVLHSDLIPPTKEVHEWDFLAFGYYDGISVGKSLPMEDGLSLSRLWDDSAEIEENLDGTETMQIIYGFRTEDDQEINTDEEYWQDIGTETPYPFLFFMMIQFDRVEGLSLKNIADMREEIENKYTCISEMKGITYFTLENSDLFLVLRCKDYNYGAKVIDEIHRTDTFFQKEKIEWKIRYSFTVSAIDKIFLNEGKTDILSAGHINYAHIYAVEKDTGSIDNFYQEVKDKLCLTYSEEEMESHIGRKQSVLGYNDELIQLMDLPWDLFLALYKDETGILNHSSEIYQQYITCITTIIGLEQEIDIVPHRQSGNKKNDVKESLNTFCKYLKEVLQEISGYHSAVPALHRNVMLSLNNLINSFSKFFNSHISENLFFPSVCSIHMLILILREGFLDGRKIGEEEKYYQECRRFLNALNLYAQNASRSDRQFTQAIEFNVRIYDVPIKLNAFYNAFIFRVKEYLGDASNMEKNHRYEFLAYPCVSANMYVEELFKRLSEDKRLFLVHIPENQVYNMENMMIMLCHEVAHFVDRSIRSRDERSGCICGALCRIVTLHYQYNLKEMEGERFEGFWEEFESELNKLEKNYMKGLSTEEGMKHRFSKSEGLSGQEYEKKINGLQAIQESHRSYSEIMKDGFIDSMIKIIREQSEQLFEAGLYGVYMESYRKNHDSKAAKQVKKDCEKNIEWCSQELIRGRKGEKDIVNIEMVMDMLIGHCKECLSDIVGIMTLEISPGQYYHTLFQSAKNEGREVLLTYGKVNDILVRASLVTACMIQKKDGMEWTYHWSKDFTKDKNSEEVYTFAQRVKHFIEEYMVQMNPALWDREMGSIKACDFMCDKKVLDYIRKYLMKCRVKISDRIKRGRGEQQGIQEMFSLARSINTQDQMIGIQNVVEQYRETVNQKIKQTVESDTNKTEDEWGVYGEGNERM